MSYLGCKREVAEARAALTHAALLLTTPHPSMKQVKETIKHLNMAMKSLRKLKKDLAE